MVTEYSVLSGIPCRAARSDIRNKRYLQKIEEQRICLRAVLEPVRLVVHAGDAIFVSHLGKILHASLAVVDCPVHDRSRQRQSRGTSAYIRLKSRPAETRVV